MLVNKGVGWVMHIEVDCQGCAFEKLCRYRSALAEIIDSEIQRLEDGPPMDDEKLIIRKVSVADCKLAER